VDHRRDRALAVGTRDVQRDERALGMTERRAQSPDVVETQLDAERLELEQT
jgi:hypothetical protein